MAFTLALPLLLHAIPAQADALATLKSSLSGTTTLQGRFTQTVVQQNGKPQQSAGDFAIQRPGKFRWSYSAPYEQLIVGDGAEVWLYDPDLRQATVKSMGNALESSPAALLAGDNALEKNYQLKPLASRNGIDWFDARPRQEDAGFSSIRLGLKNGQIVEMELIDRFEQLTRIRFDNVKRNTRLDPTLFRFTPPKDVDVVRE
ncbi:outer membrane lipoprotein chaperone LolA [Chitiniphilus eburneus]|uniref:Outer-membrane lipoprotein carrier protein n=1 Tax=Chitiniphilus eburneus TaxID=2571148 RepID=A0A4U0QDC3_9NEIS|nr:outer membrane lipoprotein chaperone LolA [Chitiniphilus eburneus]TJZ73854.1 outer membrane lipoprotein chaperone LolA [Chitiniphilus eburneus]